MDLQGVLWMIYDPKDGDPDSALRLAQRSKTSPEDWVCTICGARKSSFVPPTALWISARRER